MPRRKGGRAAASDRDPQVRAMRSDARLTPSRADPRLAIVGLARGSVLPLRSLVNPFVPGEGETTSNLDGDASPRLILLLLGGSALVAVCSAFFSVTADARVYWSVGERDHAMSVWVVAAVAGVAAGAFRAGGLRLLRRR